MNIKGFKGAGLGAQLLGAAAILGYGLTQSIYTGEEDVRDAYGMLRLSRGCFLLHHGSGGRLPGGSF